MCLLTVCAFVSVNASLWKLNERIGRLGPIEMHSFGDELTQNNLSLIAPYICPSNANSVSGSRSLGFSLLRSASFSCEG